MAAINGNHSKLNDVANENDKTAVEDTTELEDPFCNANNPLKITFQDVTSAAFMIKNGIELTPCPVIFVLMFLYTFF